MIKKRVLVIFHGVKKCRGHAEAVRFDLLSGPGETQSEITFVLFKFLGGK